MNAELERAKHLLFDEAELHAANFKLFPGSSRDATSEQMAGAVNHSIRLISEGDFDPIERFED